VNLGDAFLPRNPAGNRHLYIVVHRATDTCVSVNFTTKKPSFDDSCVVKAGEHPFLKHDSVVCYDRPIVWSTEKTIADWKYLIEVQKEPVGPALLRRIQEGGAKSKYAPLWLKGVLKPYLR
jgi:hypothetical protein